VTEIRDLFVFLSAQLSQVEGREATLSFEITSEDDPTLTASTELNVVFVDAAGS
jgi:acyl-CoA thioesterase FadM